MNSGITNCASHYGVDAPGVIVGLIGGGLVGVAAGVTTWMLVPISGIASVGAVMVVASKDPDYFSRTPAHYFAGMVARAKNGTLRLDRSIWGLRTRQETTGKS